MTPSQSSQTLSDLIRRQKRPRNQIATLSGLTNTYIRNLENGEIANVPKKRLIALGVALNLDLSEVEDLLAAFDRASLSEADIPFFIQTAKDAQLSEAVLPIRDFLAYELIMLSIEQAKGHQVIVNDRPTASLMVEGHRTHKDRAILSRHPIYKALNEAIGHARRDNFSALLKAHPVDLYICRQCLEDYLAAEVDDTERAFRYRHVAALRDTVTQESNFRLFLTRTCANLLFTLKLTARGKGNDKLSYSAKATHDLYRGKRGRLMGFITENPALCECFKEELAQIALTVIGDMADKPAQIAYLTGLIAPLETELKENA